MNVLVLITGTGRSGTSTMSGTLHHLGLFVPGPHFGANESNPKGFFESRWAVKFHKALEAAAGIDDFDSRPEAVDRARQAVTPEMREALVTFLGKHVADHPQVVVKDPRSVWAQGLWREAARDAGMEIRYVSMLRHPAEVVGSRATYYAGRRDEEQRRRYVTISVARWINGSIISERETRGQARAFVRYNDLLEDWRPVLTRLRDGLGLTYDGDLATGVPSPVDDFIDPSLRRHQVTWDELEVPTELRDVAQQVWEDVSALGDAGGVDAEASADLDVQADSYRRLFVQATAISHDAIEGAARDARLAGAAEERERAAERAATEGDPGDSPAAVESRPVQEVGGRDLLRIAAGRALRRLRR